MSLRTDPLRVHPGDVERRALRAWPPEEVHRLAGWKLYYAGGFSRRANSAAPSPLTIGIDYPLGAAAGWYDERHLPLVIRMTPDLHEVDKELDERSFTKEGLTDVMTVALDAAPVSDGTDVEIHATPSESWLEVQARLQGVAPRERSSWEGILRRIEPKTAFAVATVAGRPIGAGLAVADEDWVGLFEINIEVASRRKGHGSALSSRLLEWGADQGASVGYLQVVADNFPAREMYRSLGFEPAYRYWYRRAPKG